MLLSENKQKMTDIAKMILRSPEEIAANGVTFHVMIAFSIMIVLTTNMVPVAKMAEAADMRLLKAVIGNASSEGVSPRQQLTVITICAQDCTLSPYRLKMTEITSLEFSINDSKFRH